MPCTSQRKYLTLLPYYHNKTQTNIQDQFVHGVSLYNGSKLKIWESFLNVLKFTKTEIPNELKDTKENPMYL